MAQIILEDIEVRLSIDYLKHKEEFDHLTERVIYTSIIDTNFNYSLGNLEYCSVDYDTEVLNTPNLQGNVVVNCTDAETT